MKGKLAFLLDSTTTPSYLKHPSPWNTETQHNSISVDTENCTAHTSQNYQMRLRLPMGVTIDTNSYTLPNISNNLLSLDDVINICGPVLFTQTGEFLLRAQFASIMKP